MGGGGSRRHGRQSVLRILIHKIWGYLIHTTIKLLELAAMTGFDHLTSKEIKGIEDKVPPHQILVLLAFRGRMEEVSNPTVY